MAALRSIQTLDYLREEGRGMYWSNLHAIEMAVGLVEAMLDGIESNPEPQKEARGEEQSWSEAGSPG